MARPGRPRDRQKETFWRQTLQRFEGSGLSAAQFCRRHGLALSSFWAWKRTLRLRQQQTKAAPAATAAAPPKPSQPTALPFFVPLRLQQDNQHDAGVSAPPLLEVFLPNGLRLRLPQHFDSQALQRLLSLLRGVTC